MLVSFRKASGVVSIACLFGVCAWSQTAQTPAAQKNWKDRAEYDLYDSITKAQDLNKRLELLNQWSQKYAATDYRQERLLLFLNTYQGLNQGAPMYRTAQEIVANDANDFTGLYWLNMLAPVQPNAPQDTATLDIAAKAGRGLLENIDKAFAKDRKPAQASDADWSKARDDMSALAHKTLGWVASSRKNHAEAETHLRESIRLNPASGEVASWLGSTLYAQKKVPEGLFYLARASSYSGPGALPEPLRASTAQRLAKAYAGYHGDASGLEELRKLAAANAVPPEGFAIKSVVDVHAENVKAEEAAVRTDPQGALWKRIRTELTGDNGSAYFESNLKGTKPPEKSFRGKVVSATAKEVQIAMTGDTIAEATLRFDTPIPKVEPGTTLYFTGVADSYSREPFMLTFDVERADVEGFPAARKPAGPKTRGRTASVRK